VGSVPRAPEADRKCKVGRASGLGRLCTRATGGAVDLPSAGVVAVDRRAREQVRGRCRRRRRTRGRTSRGSFPTPSTVGRVRHDPERFERVDPRRGDGARVSPVIAEVEGVEELPGGGRREQDHSSGTSPDGLPRATGCPIETWKNCSLSAALPSTSSPTPRVRSATTQFVRAIPFNDWVHGALL
jgi:hypothetical protein